jgi:hypothetical protein
MDISEFPDSLKQLVEGEFERDERVLWSGQEKVLVSLADTAATPQRE